MKLILLPGIHGKEILFDDFIVYLAPDIDAEVMALPDHGRQSYTRLTELISALLPIDEDYVLLGESFSGVIAKRIAESHQASLEVQSAVGEGTTFTFTVPLSDRGASSAAG